MVDKKLVAILGMLGILALGMVAVVAISSNVQRQIHRRICAPYSLLGSVTDPKDYKVYVVCGNHELREIR